MKTLFSNKKNFDKYLSFFLENRKKKIQSNTVSVSKKSYCNSEIYTTYLNL